MAAPSDALRATLDRLAIPAEALDDREYLISMLRRLGYTERQIEMELGIKLDGSESKTIELEYSEEAPEPEPVIEEPPAPSATSKKVETVTVEERVEATASATPAPPEPLPEPEPEDLLDFSPPASQTPSWERVQKTTTTTERAARQDAWVRGDAASASQFAYKVDYRLYYRDVKLPTGRVQRIYFFSRSTPKVGVPCGLPEGYEVCENSRTGLPFLARIDEAEALRVEAAESELAASRRKGIFGGRRRSQGVIASGPVPEPGEDQGGDEWGVADDDDVASEPEALPATAAANAGGGQWELVDSDADGTPAEVLPAADSGASPGDEAGTAEDWSAWDDFEAPGPAETVTKAATADGAFRYGEYALYRREVPWSGGGTRIIHFFDDKPPKEGEACDLPDGYEVRVNDRTGMPYLVRSKTPGERVRVKVVRAASPEEAAEKARAAGLNVRGAIPVDVNADDLPGEAKEP